MNEYLVIIWANSVPAEDGLAEAARDGGGQLLAAGLRRSPRPSSPAHPAATGPAR
jgi:hypothetical protein